MRFPILITILCGSVVLAACNPSPEKRARQVYRTCVKFTQDADKCAKERAIWETELLKESIQARLR